MRWTSYIRLLSAFAGALVVSPAFPQTLPASVIACADEADVLKRLSCYDHEVARYRTAPARPPSAATPPIAGEPVASATVSPEDAAADFGMNGELKRKEGSATPQPAKLSKLTARVASVSNRPTGEGIYTLEGGQVWVEAESASHLPLRPGEQVTIKRGALGAFYLSSARVRGLRVKRVQ
ncbi:MAG TPA: hypothetical protein VI653_00155 [Steroidobacteraceae bacterium]